MTSEEGLELSEAEQRLISQLENSPQIKFNSILKSYFESIPQGVHREKLERLNSTFLWYYQERNTPPGLGVSPFQNAEEKLNQVFQSLKEIEESLGKTMEGASTTLRSLLGDKYEICIGALTKVDPPILNIEGKFALGERQKSVIAVWWDIVKSRGFHSKQITSDQLAAIVLREFGLKVTVQTLSNGKHSTTATKYSSQLKNLIKLL